MNKRLILGSVLGCSIAYAGYSYYSSVSYFDELEKNAKIKPVAGGMIEGMKAPEKKVSGAAGTDGKKAAGTIDANSAAASARPVVLVAAPSPAPITAPVAGSALPSTPTPMLAAPSPSASSVQLAATQPTPMKMPTPLAASNNAELLPPPPLPANMPSQVPPQTTAGLRIAMTQTPQIEKSQKSCDWKSGGTFANIRFGQHLFRFNLRSDLSAASALLKRFEGHAKATVLAQDSKSDCVTGDCFIIPEDFMVNLSAETIHEFECGDWYLVTDGSQDGCGKQSSTHSLRFSKTSEGQCVIGSLIDARISGPALKAKVVTSSMYVTGKKLESPALAPREGTAND